jgi:hypothetical protein
VELKRRIASLQRALQIREGAEIEDFYTTPSSGYSSPTWMNLTLPFLAANDHPILFRHKRHLSSLDFVFARLGLKAADFGHGIVPSIPSLPQPPTSGHVNDLPTGDEARSIIKSLVESAKHGPSNLDKIISLSRLEEDCRLVYGPAGVTSPHYADSRFRCFTTVFLAMCMRAAANGDDVTTDAKAMTCWSFGMSGLPTVTAKEDLVSCYSPHDICSRQQANLSRHVPRLSPFFANFPYTHLAILT